jgi:hypothetical protein
VFSITEALEPRWREHFQNAQGEWLIPFLEQLGDGIHPDWSELLAISKARLGCDPEIFEVPSSIADLRR